MNDPRNSYREQFKKMGEKAVRHGLDIGHIAGPRAKHARAWLRELDRECAALAAVSQDELARISASAAQDAAEFARLQAEAAEEANRLAAEANEIAREARDKAHRANHIAKWAIAIATIAIAADAILAALI